MLELESRREIPKLKVSASCFNIVMICWSKQRTLESAHKVQAIFDRLIQLSENDPSKRPVGGSYIALITTWARFDPIQSEKAFWDWRDEHENGNCEMRIDSELLGTLVAAWYNSKEPTKAERCDKLIQDAIQSKIPSLEPTTVVFNMAINAWCRNNTIAGVKRAEELLEQMHAYSETNPGSKLKPNVLTYRPIILAWVILGRMERAEELLSDCVTRFGDNTGLPSADNNYGDANKSIPSGKMNSTRLFNIVLKGWLSKAQTMPEAASRAEDLLLSMNMYGVKPNAASFRYVLDAWRKNKSRFKHQWDRNQPKADEVLAFLDREARGFGTSNNLYLTLKQGWKLLLIQ
jgi:hypothetical protein